MKVDNGEFSEIVHGKAKLSLSYGTEFVTPAILKAIESGQYEWQEALAAKRILRPDDRVLELGAGLGFLSSFVQSTTPVAKYLAVEADARLLAHIRKTHTLNNIQNVELINAAVTSSPEALSSGYMDFTQNRAFWASGPETEHGVKTRVSTIPFHDIVREQGVNVVLCDIEGGEWELLNEADLSAIRALSMEIHPAITGRKKIASMFDQIHAQGLLYDSTASNGQVVAFTRDFEDSVTS